MESEGDLQGTAQACDGPQWELNKHLLNPKKAGASLPDILTWFEIWFFLFIWVLGKQPLIKQGTISCCT